MMRETLQWMLQKITLLRKKTFLADEEYLASGLPIKAVRNNDEIKGNEIAKIEALSEK